MVRLYFDLETYRPRKEGAFIDEKIISAGLLVDETPYASESYSKEPVGIVVSEWGSSDECGITRAIHEHIKTALRNHQFTVLCGFNILRFDIPLMISRAVKCSLGTHDEIAKMWNDCFTLDMFQQLLTANRDFFKGLTLRRVVDISEKMGLNPPKYTTAVSEIKDLYTEGRYREIEEHLKQDLTVIRWLDLHGARKLIENSMKTQTALFRE